MYEVASLEEDVRQLERIWVRGHWDDEFSPYSALCDFDRCRIFPVDRNSMPTGGPDLASNDFTILIGKQFQKYQEDHIPIPLAPVNVNCGIPRDLRDTTSNQPEKIEWAIRSYITMGLRYYTAQWAMPLADGGVAVFDTQQYFAEFLTWHLDRPGDGIARPSNNCNGYV